MYNACCSKGGGGGICGVECFSRVQDLGEGLDIIVLSTRCRVSYLCPIPICKNHLGGVSHLCFCVGISVVGEFERCKRGYGADCRVFVLMLVRYQIRATWSEKT